MNQHVIHHEIDLTRLIITSHSIDNLFDYCPRKFEFAHLYENRPIDKDSGYAADCGTAIHRGIQAWLVAKAEGRSELEARTIGGWSFCRFFPWAEEANQKQKTRTFEACYASLEASWDHNFWDDWELVKVHYEGDSRWAVEVPWLLIHSSFGPTADGRFFATQGTIDLIMKHKRSGVIIPIDIKSTVYDEDLTRSMYTYSGQQVGYGQVVEAMLGNQIHELTVYYFIVRISAIEPKIQAEPFEKDREKLEDYWLDKLDRLERMRKYVNQKRFPRTNGGCFTYSTECAFFNICATREPDVLHAWFSDATKASKRLVPNWWVRLEV